MTRAIKAGALYFAIVFGIGFVVGAIRTLLIVPRVGARTAELLEAPIMIAVSFITARWIVRRLAIPFVIRYRLSMGAVGLLLLLGAEFGLVLWLRGISIQQYFATRDPVAAAVYYLALLLFATAPVMVVRHQKLLQP